MERYKEFIFRLWACLDPEEEKQILFEWWASLN